MEVRFVIPGPPQGKARARTVHNRRTGYTQSFTPAQTVLYENLIKTMYWENSRQIWNNEEALKVSISAVYEPPKSTSKRNRERMLNGQIWPTKKPDADNIAKVVLDALNGVAYKDDTQVVHLDVIKMYGESAYVEVTIRPYS